MTKRVFAVDPDDELFWPISRYGQDWVAFVDDLNHDIRYVNLTATDEEIRDMELNTRYIRGHGEVTFYLYTKENRREILSYPNYNSKYLDPTAPFYILVHGWLQDVESDFNQQLKRKIISQGGGNINIVVMDWYNLQSFLYVTTAKRTEEASTLLRQGIEDLAVRYLINGSAIHIIGHGLGAHVAGKAGKELKGLNFVISRITGLDPSRPYFEHPKRYEGISKESAAFVDIIHTSAGILGIKEPAGTSDFYPNGGGPSQPACCRFVVRNKPGACEHRCGYFYYEKSFDTNYEAVKCDTWERYMERVCDMDEIQNMGERTLDWSHGLYFVEIYGSNDTTPH